MGVRLIWLAALLLSAMQLLHTPINLDLNGFLPSHANPAQRLLTDQMRDGVGGRLVLLSITGDSPERLAHISQKLAMQMQRSSEFEVVANGTSLPADQLEWLMARRYLLTPNLSAESFSIASLRQSLETSLRLLASPLGGQIQVWLPRDPGGVMLALLQSLGGQNPPSSQHGVWFSHDGQRALLLAYSRAKGLDARGQERALASIQKAFAVSTHMADGKISPAHLQLSGAAVFAAEARQEIERAAQRVTLLSAMLVTLILWLAYRAWKPVAYSLIPVLTGFMVGAAAVGAWFGSIHGITLAFGAILIGEAVDYPAYLFTHRVNGETLDVTATRIRHALRLAMLTSALGALFLLLSDLEGLRQLGVLTASGVLAAGLTTRWLLATFKLGQYHLPRVPTWPQPPRWLAWLLLAGAILVLVRSGVIWDDDLANLSPIRPEAMAQDRALRGEIGAPDARFLVTFTAPQAEAALALSERHMAWLDRLIQDGTIAGYTLAAQSLPSQSAQAARRGALPDYATASRNLQQALTGLPFRSDTFAPFLDDLEVSRSLPPIRRGDLDGTPWAARADALLTRSGEQWVALAPLSGVSDGVHLAAAVKQLGAPGVALLDIKRETEALLSNARQQALMLILAGIVTISLVLWWGLGKAQAAAKTLLPVLAAMLTTTATLRALDIPLNLFHLISLLLVLGIGLNYALFFQRRDGNPALAQRAGLAVGLCGLTSVVAFACLALAGIPVLHAIGLTVLLGTLFSLFYAASWRSSHSAPNHG